MAHSHSFKIQTSIENGHIDTNLIYKIKINGKYSIPSARQGWIGLLSLNSFILKLYLKIRVFPSLIFRILIRNLRKILVRILLQQFFSLPFFYNNLFSWRDFSCNCKRRSQVDNISEKTFIFSVFGSGSGTQGQKMWISLSRFLRTPSVANLGFELLSAGQFFHLLGLLHSCGPQLS